MLWDWALDKLEAVRDHDNVLMKDPLHLLPEANPSLHAFARENGYTVVVASTNLAFRELYENAVADVETKRLLVLDRAPARRKSTRVVTKAPPPFYPDFLAKTSEEARIELELRQFLIETTNDSNWPSETNDPLYARLIVKNIRGVLRAHANLRAAKDTRFTDQDFKTIVAYAALGVSDSAFKMLDAEDYWRICLLGHRALDEIDDFIPEITKPIKVELSKAPAPFCWFADRDPETIVRVFYLSAILQQHTDNWNLLLANVDPSLVSLSGIDVDVLEEAAPKLVKLNLSQADSDLEAVENSLGRDAIQLLLLDQIGVSAPASFAAVIENEHYSTLFRSLALLFALDNTLSKQRADAELNRVSKALFADDGTPQPKFVDGRKSVAWHNLRESFRLGNEIQSIRNELANAIKYLKVLKTEQLTFAYFREIWNDKRINRLEYFLSSLERRVYSGEFLPRAEDELPSAFANALARIRQTITTAIDEVNLQLDELNCRFQEMVFAQYKNWISADGDVRLTSQFLRRCLKPNWDPQTEKAAVFIFDGMRYDIWDEFLKPMLGDRMELLADIPASSLLPSETHITRKAISAGTTADFFDSRSGEDVLLKEGLAREFNYTGSVEVIAPDAMGVGETVRYRAGNLDVYIFELCDKELHKIGVKTLPDGRQVPSRPLEFVYQQHLKNIFDTEVMAIVRKLAPGTKVFITADHGFGRVHRDRVWVEEDWLNEPRDCAYRNAWLMGSLATVGAPTKVRNSVWEFPIKDLRLPEKETVTDPSTKKPWEKRYASVIFPKTGYALSRPGSNFRPDAYTHGGISIQELMIPMAVLRVKSQEEGLLLLEPISCPDEVLEGQEIEFSMPIRRASASSLVFDDLRIDVEAIVSPGDVALPHQVLFLGADGVDVVYTVRPDTTEAKADERLAGSLERLLTIAVTYRENGKTVRKSQAQKFSIQLNSEKVVRRVPPGLGNILGMTPKGMR